MQRIQLVNETSPLVLKALTANTRCRCEKFTAVGSKQGASNGTTGQGKQHCLLVDNSSEKL